jgi:hypothetical protein
VESNKQTNPGATRASGGETPRIQQKEKEQTRPAAEQPQYVPGQVAEKPQNVAGQAVEQTKQVAGQAVEQTKHVAGQVADQARHQVKSQLATGKERAADSMSSVADALRLAGDQLREQKHEHMSSYADSAAEMVENVSRYLGDHDIDRIFGEVEGFARRQPALFLGGAFALGFMASRFLKSSSPYDHHGNGHRYWREGNGSGYGHPLPTAYERTASGTPPFDVPVSGTASPSVAGTGAGLDVPPATGTLRE